MINREFWKKASEQLCIPVFESRRKVRALEIINMELNGTGYATAKCRSTKDGSEHILSIENEVFVRYQPVSGDMLIFYEDGYVSVCPRKSFDEGYQPL